MLDPQPNYYVRSFLNIPQTNILIVNTISDIVQGSSIVYYIDMETSGGSVINVVKHSCLNPSIGDLFTSETYQFLILACDDFSIISYDLKAGNKNQITQLTQIPFVLQIFNNKNLIGIGDKSKGTAVFFKFNAPSFGFLIEINPGKNKDTILQIDILVDGTLWLQFINSNLFIPFSQCISDHNNCLICQQNFYFKIQNGYDQKQTYGQGIINQEYRTSQSFVTAMIRAQIYQEVVQATQAMTVNISIDQSNPFSLSTVLLNFDFSNIISLMMQCTQCQNGQYFTLKFPDSMVFRNYLQIQLNQVSIDFTELSADDDCGITLQNIQNNSTINDIQIISQKNAKQNCNQIQINNATVTISNYTISGQDFSNTSSIITTINTGQINLISLSLVNSILGRSFSVLSQLSDVTANLNQISISNNTCAQNVADDTIVSSLFSASLFAVQNFNISYNYLCNTLIFTTVASIEQHNQIFRFDNVTLLGNQLVTKTTYILFNALYSMLSKPDHQVIFTNLSITYNKLVVANSLTDQQISSFISTSKVSNVSLINTNFVNQHHIFLSIIDTSNNVQIVNANCINEQSYNLNQTVLARTAGCLYFTEVQQLNISTINIINKNTIDENLIKFESFITKSIQITIDNANLTGIAQTQLAGNAPMNPIYIMVMYDLQASITNSVFTQNTYTIDETKSDKFIISTNGLGAHFLTGNINIQNCTFFNSSSNSGYNYIYIVGDVVNMNQVNFTQSSYSDLALNQPYLFKNRGGNLYIQINYLNITNCLFSQSTSMLGSFIYAMPISSLLQIHIQDTTFNEGYANIDGGAIYLYPSNTIHFNCKNCDFIDIYTMNIADTSAIIGLENSATLDTSHHVFNFDGGIIKNIFGNGDNTFLSLQSVDIIIQNYQTITTVSTNSLYSIFAKMLNTQNVGVQPAQITNAAQQSLLISASQSIVNITNCKFSQSIFKFQAISIVQGNLSLNQVTFYNISQYQNKRSLQQLVVQNPIAKGNSLILLQNSQLQITNLSLFQNINCTLNCNGGSIQLLNSQFSISDTTFNYSNVNILFQFSNIKASFSQADFGGAIFIQGIVNENSIQNASFLSNQANFDGGAIFFNSMLTDKFSLTIDKSTFSENLSINSRGGALYILSNAYNSVVQSFAIQNTIIQSNKAMVGGAINSQNISPKSINNQFIGNQALIYGNNQISYPTQLDYYNITQFLQDNQNATFKEGLLTISNFRSGENLPTIYLQFKNEEAVLYPITNSDFQQYVIDVNVFQAQQNPDYDVSGNISSIYDKNTKSFILTEIKIVGTPNSSQYYEFKSNIIKVLDPNTQQYSSDYSLRFLIQFRECIAGEEVQKYNQLLECSPCSQNMYSLDSKGCKQCPDGANCLGGTNITVKNDYWRRSYESDLIIQCENQLSNCIGGSYGNLLCFQGHIGALCEECDIYGEYWDSKYAKSGKYSCTNCNQITGNLYIVILMTAWTMFSMTIAIKSDIDTLEYEAGALKIKKITRKKGQNNSIIRPTNVTLSKQKKFGNSQEDGAKAEGCLNPSIGDLFVSSQYQFLILSCDDLTVISYDLKSGFKKIIKQLTQVPFVLSLFNNKQVIGIGNKAKGTALLYKFNAPNFDFLIEVNPGKNQDVILAIDFLIDGTLWLQFSNSNLFIPFNQCISDPKNCLICQQNFYFKIQNGYDQSQTYGKGLIGFEYRTSQSFVTAMIKITLISFSLFQSVLGRNFSVISQLSNVIINLDQINISENVCAQNVPDDSVVSSLFSASLFSVSNFNITNNNFCNSLIFTTVASIQQHNQIFQFNNLTIYGNQFVTKTTYILFNALYSMLSKPDHQVMFTNLNINDNKLIVSNAQTDQKISSFISTSKVLNVTFTNINFVNQNHIFLSIIDNSDNVQIVNTNCTNEQSFNDNNNQQDLTRTAGCLYFTEVSSLNISTINIINKNTVDENLIKFESFFTQSSKILIDKANISGINQTQKAGNAPMNPIYLMVMYDLQFSITNSVFKHNTYTINENTQDKTIISTTGIGARFLTGALNIQKCTFFNSSSNSQFNNIYILGDTANLNEVNFISSSYSEQILNQPFFFKNHGGNLYLQINYINLTNCHFSQSTSQLGSFIYAMPISAPLQIYIQDSIFSEGYASIDGGAIYLYPSNTINFNCKNCSFIDIYTMNSNSAATLGFENSVTQDTSRHNINFNGGIIKNLFGNGDNTFMTLQTADITIQNYQKITIESINPHYLDLLKKIYTSDGQLVQPAQLVNIQSCTLKVSNCNVINWNQINASQQPLIINSQQSQVNLSNCNFTNIIFKKQALSIIQGNLSLNHILFNDISQIQNKRSLQQLIVQTPVADGSSLIQLQNSNIQITNFTLFQNINCIENCNGGTLQLQNSQFTISDTTFKNSYADFGGAIFIEGIPQVNKINNCNFIQNNANYDGGAIYFNSDLKDKFSFTVDQSKFIENISKNSKGGAFFIYSSAYNSDNQFITISNSLIQQNKAVVGGAINNQNISPKSINNQFIDNKALIYGNDQISYPTELDYYNINQFLQDNKNSTYQDGLLTLSNFRSGDNLPKISLQFKNQDVVLYPITDSDYQQYIITVDVFQGLNNPNYDVSGNITTVYDKNTKSFAFSGIKIIGTPNFWDSKYAKSGKYSCTNCNQITGNLYVVILLTAWTMLSMTIAIKADIETLENEAGALKIKQNLRKKGKNNSIIRPANSLQPYKEQVLNRLDEYSTICSAATILFGVFIYSNPYPYLVILGFVFLVIINACPEEKRAFILKLYEQELTATNHPEYDKIKTNFIQKMDFYQFKQDSKTHLQAKNTKIVFNLQSEGNNNQQTEGVENNEELIIFDSESSQLSEEKSVKVEEQVSDQQQSNSKRFFQHNSKPSKTQDNSFSNSDKKTKDLESQKPSQVNQPEQTIFCQFEAENQN
ncbi:hypothetical protein ABPG74_012394 [Tetrahymena malaccensis]